MKPRPGDRRRRWQQSHNASATIITVFAVLILVLTDGTVFSWVLAAILLFTAVMDIRAAKRGWRMKDEPPPWAYQHAARGDKFAQDYIAEWEQTKHERRKPRYAFNKEKRRGDA